MLQHLDHHGEIIAAGSRHPSLPEIVHRPGDDITGNDQQVLFTCIDRRCDIR
ncbi:MAG: hypothetical protein ABII68_00210 [Pseudomonadota bacterium]